MAARQSLWGGPSDPPCLLDAFHATARRLAEQVALVDEEHEVHYGQLLAWISDISGTLARHGIRPGDRVAVTGVRSAPTVAAMFAVVAAGATYVPLDIAYPRAQLSHMLRDSEARLVLHAGPVPDFGVEVAGEAIPVPGKTSFDLLQRVPCEAELPVYVIYTSGSTGLPKGVALPHSCIDTMAQWQQDHSVRRDLRTAQFAPMNFDVWFQEALGTLCGGGTLAVMPERLRRDPLALLDWLVEQRIERLFLPCVALHMLTVAASDLDSLEQLALKEINVAGEQLVCTPAIRDFFRRLPDCRLNNHYGQSESAMVTVHTLAGPSGQWPALPPIGQPLPGCEVLLDPVSEAEPDVGELLVCGRPLAAGYLHQPELNQQRYIDIDKTDLGHVRAFRTGDLVRFADGVVHFLGRVDHEVKIRGFRVNPLEVDACLLTLPHVVEAVCVAISVAEGSRQLRAAVTVDCPAEDFDTGQALRRLGELLPAHAVPTFLTVVAELPRTPSGKVDREGVARALTGRR